MQRSKTLIAQALSILRANIERTGDPLGFKKPYWIEWVNGLGLPRSGPSILLTARMYQMLPYVIQATEMTAAAKPVLPLLSLKVFGRLMELGNRYAAETVIRLGAKRAKQIRDKGHRALQGIVLALQGAGVQPAYLYEDEPYSGALLYDLGLEADTAPYVRDVHQLLQARGVKSVITVDPHTNLMLKEIFPKFIPDCAIRVRHYLDLLAENLPRLGLSPSAGLPERFVMHDSCVMTRDLGIVEQARTVADRLGIALAEPESTRQNTACCGGPVEYAYADLSARISRIRIQELAAVCPDILVTCPICLINLSKYEKRLGIRVWDLGEVLYRAQSGGTDLPA